VDVGYLALAMESRLVLDQATSCATGIAQKTVPLAGLRRMAIPLPPLAEQHRIVARVDELMALCDQLEASLAAADTANARLLDAILHEALNGPPEAKAA
jgi:type I restriction enzyme S subunit